MTVTKFRFILSCFLNYHQWPTRMVAIGFVMLSASCCCQVKSTPEGSHSKCTAVEVSASQPAVFSVSHTHTKYNFGDTRAGAAERRVVLAYQQAFIAAGGPRKRGREFEELMNAIINYNLTFSISDFEVFALLGPPDRATNGGGEAVYTYSCDRFAARDWTYIIEVAKDGKISGIHQNDTADLPIGDIPKYTGWPNVSQRK